VFVERFDDPQALERVTLSPPDQGFKRAEVAWRVEGGRLYGAGGHNSALWFNDLTLPQEARIEFTTRAETETGDVKCELYGDYAHHQSGYIIINGGWKNTTRVIARQDEHAEERKEDRRCGPRCAPQGEEQRWVIERRGAVITWYLNGQLALRYHDSAPLQGQGFAFNHWEAEVSFDDLVVYDLASDHL
jgi:hypothetical protein